MASGPRPSLYLSARDVPVPSSVSEEAQALLALGPLGPAPDWPEIGDVDGWRALIAEREAAGRARAEEAGPITTAWVEEIDADGAHVYVIAPKDVQAGDPRVVLEIHGGGFIQDGGSICRHHGLGVATSIGAKVWAVDYRMPPDHPYPTPLDDCVSAYRALLREHRPEGIIVSGGSAGGNLAAAMILRARDEGLPLPAAAVLMSPEADLTESGDSFRTNLGLDNALAGSLMPANLLYASGHDLRHPYLSPLFADFTQGFPPTMLIAGTRDLFLSNTVLLHRALRAADVLAELHVFEAAGHCMFLGEAPEDEECRREIRRFAKESWWSVSR